MAGFSIPREAGLSFLYINSVPGNVIIAGALAGKYQPVAQYVIRHEECCRDDHDRLR